MEHHAFGSSSLPRRVACTASFLAEQQCDPLPDTDISVTGTQSHNITEWCGRHVKDSQDYADTVDETLGGVPINQRDITLDRVQDALDYVRDIVPGRLWHHGAFEVKIWFGDEVPSPTPAFGWVDMMYPDFDERVLYLFDLKFGFKRVAASSEQLLELANGARNYYALDAPGGKPFDKVVIGALQPTLNWYDVIERTVDELEDWGMKTLRPKILENLDVNEAKYNPDAGVCTYCSARAQCPARMEKLYPLFSDGVIHDLLTWGRWANVDFIEAPVLTPEQVDLLYPAMEDTIRLCKDIKELTERRILSEQTEVEGFCISSTRTNRDWSGTVTADDMVEKLGVLRSQLFDNKLRSPAQLEKLLPGTGTRKKNPDRYKALDALVVRAEGRPTVKKTEDSAELQTIHQHFKATITETD